MRLRGDAHGITHTSTTSPEVEVDVVIVIIFLLFVVLVVHVTSILVVTLGTWIIIVNLCIFGWGRSRGCRGCGFGCIVIVVARSTASELIGSHTRWGSWAKGTHRSAKRSSSKFSGSAMAIRQTHCVRNYN